MLACTDPADPPTAAPTTPAETEPPEESPPIEESPPTTPVPGDPENVLLVVLDDIGAEYIGLYGMRDDTPPTPTIDGLAANGRLFRNAWSMAMCSATRASLMTGRYPSRTGVGAVTDFGGRLAPEETTLPELLAEAEPPWSASLVGKWHLVNYDDPGYDTDAGLQGFPWSAVSDPIIGDYYRWQRNLNGVVSIDDRYVTTVQADDTLDRIREMPEPWLLFLSFNAPHGPIYQDPPEELVPGPATDVLSTYFAMITAADLELGRVLGSMDPEVLARTTVVVMGDNGTAEDVEDPLLDRRGKMTVFQGGIHVPMVVSGPRVERPGEPSDALVDVVDLFPTIAEIAGVVPDGLPIDGASLLPLFADPTASVHDTVYAEFFMEGRECYAVRDDRYKLVVTVEGESYGPDVQLYDLVVDPTEQTNLASELGDVRDRLQGVADDLRQSMAADPLGR